MAKLEDLTGLWRRSLLAWPDGASDTATAVRWLQGPDYYADLRQPEGRPNFDGVACLRQLERSHLDWMAQQEGFAGRLGFDGACYTWRRDIDLQPQAAYPDAGRLWFEGDLLVEAGRDVAYIEHWIREPCAKAPCAAVLMRDAIDSRPGLLVRVGDLFIYARGRAAALPSPLPLADCVRTAASLTEAQDLVDCEISLGAAGGAGWIIERSSLPFKEGCPFTAASAAGGGQVLVGDIGPDGAATERRWVIRELRGEIDDLTQPAPAWR